MKQFNKGLIEHMLTVEARRFLKEAYGFDLAIPVIVNSRLKSTYGRFLHYVNMKQSLRIEIGKNYIENQPWNIVLETLVHESIHYYLYEMDLPYRDGQAVFEAELRKHGSHSTGTIKYKGKVVQYRCPSCGRIMNKKKRYPRNRRYQSGCCKAIIEFVGEKVI